MIRTLMVLSLIFLAATWANAQPKSNAPQKAAEKKTKEMLIKELEEEKKVLHLQEKATLHNLDARADYIIKYLDPKLVGQQMEATAKLVREVHDVISVGEFDYGGHRGAAQKSLDLAEHHLHEAIKFNSHEQRKLAAEHLIVAHRDVNKALVYSVEKYGLGTNTAVKSPTEPETRAAANRQLSVALPNIEFTYHLLAATDHEITDYNKEKRTILSNRDGAKKQVKEQVALQIKGIDAEIKALRK